MCVPRAPKFLETALLLCLLPFNRNYVELLCQRAETLPGFRMGHEEGSWISGVRACQHLYWVRLLICWLKGTMMIDSVSVLISRDRVIVSFHSDRLDLPPSPLDSLRTELMGSLLYFVHLLIALFSGDRCL